MSSELAIELEAKRIEQLEKELEEDKTEEGWQAEDDYEDRRSELYEINYFNSMEDR